jgi:hypothetical protein
MPPDETEPGAGPDDTAGAKNGAAEDSHAEEVDFASYVFPDTRQRRYTAVILWVIAALGIALYASGFGGEGWITEGALAGAILLALIGIWFWLAAYKMQLDQQSALIEATRQVDFGVGHAAANLGWRSFRSRPTWRILLYSAEDPPAMRGFVELDALDGRIFEVVQESNPEDWEQLVRDEENRAD